MARKRKGTRLVQNESGYWEVHYFDEAKGKTRRSSLGVTSAAEAEKKLALWIVENTAPKDVPESAATIGGAIKLYDKKIEAELVAKDSARFSLKHVSRLLGHIKIAEFCNDHVVEYIKQRRKEGSAPNSIRHETVLLKAALGHAALNRFGGINSRPFFKLAPSGPRKEDHLSSDQLAVMYKWLRENRENPPFIDYDEVELFCYIAYMAPGRITAILELEWSRVDLEGGTIDFRTKEWQSLPPERRKKRRTVIPIRSNLIPIIAAYKEKYGDRPNLFTIDDMAMRRRLDRLGKFVGFQIGPHLLRRTYGSLASKNKVPITDIARVMGNTTQVAEEYYLRFHPDYLRNAVEF